MFEASQGDCFIVQIYDCVVPFIIFNISIKNIPFPFKSMIVLVTNNLSFITDGQTYDLLVVSLESKSFSLSNTILSFKIHHVFFDRLTAYDVSLACPQGWPLR